MTAGPASSSTAFGLGAEEGEARWFLGELLTVKASAESTGGGLSLFDIRAPRGPASPLHVHHNEAEWWYVLEGELVIWAAGSVVEAGKGAFVYSPPDTPHTFDVVSDEAHFLVGTNPGGFEAFLRACSEPAADRTLPPPGTAAPDPARLGELAAQHGIEILGPPGIPA